MTELSYEEKFALLDQKLRWEVADEIREANLEPTNRGQSLVVPQDSFYARYGKRTIDVIASAAALTVTLPINVLAFGLTLVDLGWPVVFTQQRLGRDGKTFTILKLRTMRNEYDANGKPLLGEQRVTKLGRVLRAASIDELLNFWNVLKGEMSLIGPRPLVPEYLHRFSDRHRQRLAVRPGLECPTPRALDHGLTYEEQFENDCWYVSNVSLRTDIHLIFRVVQTALDRRQNRARASSSRGSFMGYDEHGKVVTTENLPMWAIDTVLERHGLGAMAEESPDDAE